jgi:hypothetical protein
VTGVHAVGDVQWSYEKLAPIVRCETESQVDA